MKIDTHEVMARVMKKSRPVAWTSEVKLDSQDGRDILTLIANLRTRLEVVEELMRIKETV